MSAYDPKQTLGPEDCCHANDGWTPFHRSQIPAVIVDATGVVLILGTGNATT